MMRPQLYIGGDSMATKVPSHYTESKEIVSGIQKLAYKHPVEQIFQDWLEICAIAVSNSVDWREREDREKRYLMLINKYDREEQQQLVELFAKLVMALEAEAQSGTPCDILGGVFRGLELHNKYKGQFFTPNHVCNLMGDLMIDVDLTEMINSQGYVSVCEPCIGSGGIVIGFAAAMADKNWNYQQQMCVTACDIDLKCVHMAYLQLSLYGIPAVVVHGNSLTMEEWSHWYTPSYITGFWDMRERQKRRGTTESSTEYVSTNESIMDDIQEEVELKVDESGQIRMF